MTWNYRILRRREKGPDGKTRVFYALHEVYYHKKNGKLTPDGYTADAISPIADTAEELRVDLSTMLRDALRAPVIDEASIGSKKGRQK